MSCRKLRIRSPTFTSIIKYIPPSFYDIIRFYELLEEKPSLAYEYLINKCILYEGEKWQVFWIKVIDTILQNSPILTLESLVEKYDEITEKSQSDEVVARKLFMYKLAIMLNRDIEEVKNWSEEDFIYFRSSCAYFDKDIPRDYIFFLLYLSRIINFIKEAMSRFNFVIFLVPNKNTKDI